MKRACLLNSHADFTQICVQIYSILLRILLKSAYKSTQFYRKNYSILYFHSNKGR